MNYKEKTGRKYSSFIKTSYGSKAYWWGQLLPMVITVMCWTSFFIGCLSEPNYIELAKGVANFIGGVIGTCTWCIGNMLFGLMYKDYADTMEKETEGGKLNNEK